MWPWPVDFSIRGYEVALGNPQIVTEFANSLFYTVVGTLVSVVLGRHRLSAPRKDFYGRNVITAFIVFTMIFAVIPTYLVVQTTCSTPAWR